MMNVLNVRTFAPNVVQSGHHVEQIVEHVSDTDTYTEDDYVHTYELEPEEQAESEVSIVCCTFLTLTILTYKESYHTK